MDDRHTSRVRSGAFPSMVRYRRSVYVPKTNATTQPRKSNRSGRLYGLVVFGLRSGVRWVRSGALSSGLS